MTKKEFIKHLEQFPDDAEMILVDLTTDDPEKVSYEIAEADVAEIPIIRIEDEKEMSAVGIGFLNMLNPDPIQFKED